MKLVPVSLDGMTLNDSSYQAKFLNDTESLQPAARPSQVERAFAPPLTTYKTIEPRFLTMSIRMLGNPFTQIDVLHKLFSTRAGNDGSKKRLIVKDTNNSDHQWYLDCTALANPAIRGKGRRAVVYTLKADDSAYYDNTLSTNHQDITATPTTFSITPGGNYRATPTINIKPISAKASGYLYRRYVRCYNPVARAMPDYTIDITNGGWDTATLIGNAAISNQINQVAGIGAGDLSFPVDTPVGGGLTTGGGVLYVDSEQIRYSGIAGGILTVAAGGRGYGGTTAATHADNAVLKQSTILANGNDIRVFEDGQEVDRWFDTGSFALNTATTRIKIVTRLKRAADLTLGTAIPGGGSISEIVFQSTPTNRQNIKLIPTAGELLRGDERFTYTGKNELALKVTGVTRSVKGTSPAAGAVGDTLHWIEKDIQIAYGNLTGGAPTIDDTTKPILTTGTTSNTSWDYDEFSDVAKLRAGRWTPSIVLGVGDTTGVMMGAQFGDADPATAMGMRISSYQKNNNKWSSDFGDIVWMLTQPAGVTDIAYVGEAYRSTSAWPTATIEVSQDAKRWITVKTFVSPASASTWTALTGSPISLGGTYYFIRLRFVGAVGAAQGTTAAISFTDITLTLASANVPQVSLGSQTGGYHLQGRITNTTTGDYLDVDYVLDVGQTLQLNCETDTATYLKDNSNASAAVTPNSVRESWLPLLPGVANSLKWEETGVVDLDLDFSWRDRML